VGIHYVLILACDLLPDGSDIGPVTIARLHEGLDHWVLTGATPIVAASWSPRHPAQRQPMSNMMANWLEAAGSNHVLVLEAKRFNTKGELEALSHLEIDRLSIVSDGLHLQRVQVLVQRMQEKGLLKPFSVRYIATKKSSMTARGSTLEGVKKAFVQYVPFWVQDSIVFLLHKTPLRHINLSY
jgi:hypothetical protein